MQAAKPTILILTSHTGGGHMNLAQSLKEILGTNYTSIISDPLPKLVDHWYAAISRRDVHFLARQFKYTDSTFTALWIHRILALLLSQRLCRTIEHTRPQLIITTHSLLSYAVARADARLPEHIPLVFQLTDLGSVHKTWFTEKHADAYLAPTREIFAQSVEQGIEQERLYLTGRPVRRQFLDVSAATKEETLTTLNFDPGIFTLFLQGGAKGAAQVDKVIESLLQANIPLQIILAVGNNKSMETSYAGIKHVYTVPFTETIAPYMAVADIIVGKAGASFVSEAFMLEKPFLVTAVIPDQETPTLAFIEHHNLGWVRLEPTAQQELLLEIAQNPALLAEKVTAIRAYKTWNSEANQGIGTLVDRLLAQV
ncbi:MAG: glycosyltransferase [Ktedonobacteraceae bacterium]